MKKSNKSKKRDVVLSIRLDEFSLKAVDLLVDSGLEQNRSRAASHFINAGIRYSADLLKKAQLLADSVSSLRNEMVEAVKLNNLPKVMDLLSQDASLINASNKVGETAILMAAYYRANEIKELLLSKGAELNIFEAAVVGNIERVKELIHESPQRIHEYSPDGFTLLSLASHFGNDKVVSFLLSKGADIQAKSRDGKLNNTALHAAIAGNHEHIVNLLLSHGADVSSTCEGSLRLGFSPLHVAAYFGRVSIAEVLLVRGADKHAENSDGDTPASIAVSKGNQALAELLK